jgi:polysaccharide biosynthesis protein PslH
MQRALDKVTTAKSFDLIQVEDNVMANYRLRTLSPRVLTEHEVRALEPDEFDVRLLPLGDNSLISRVGLLRKIVSYAERRRWQQYQPAIWKLFDRIQVFTNRDASIIRSMAPQLAGRVRLNPFGVRIPPEADHSNEKPDSLIFIGMFMHPANVDAALWIANEIMPLLRRQRPGIRLRLVGGHAPASVRALAADDIAVTGYVPAVRPLLEEAALVLAPVRVGGGMRMKVLEAMAMGKAVVTTPLGAEGLTFDQNELPLGIGSDAGSIATIAASLLGSDQARRDLGSRARAFVTQRHTWSAYIQRLEASYAELHAWTTTQTDAAPSRLSQAPKS